MFRNLVALMRREGEYDLACLLDEMNQHVLAFDMLSAKVVNDAMVREHGLSIALIAQGEAFDNLRVALAVVSPKGMRHSSKPWSTHFAMEPRGSMGSN